MELWTYRVETIHDVDLTGYDVDAVDGHIGKVDEATYEAGSAYVVVDTGFWIFGKRRMIPASAITGVDPDEKRVTLSLTKDRVKNAPDFDEQRAAHDQYDGEMTNYYTS
jgi:hypothetical protein